MRRASFHRLAARELEDAVSYFEALAAGSGVAFLEEVERALSRAIEFPESGVVVRGQVRRLLLRRFPCAILYAAEDTEIRVLAIMNLRRHPTYWVSR